jgi:benzoate membrane transport protein
MPLEPAATPVPRPRQILADLGGLHASNAVVAFLFSCTGPVAIILSVGARGRLTESDIASWIFAAFFINGLLSFAFTLAYRQPLVFLWSIPGAVLLGPALGHLTFPQIIGAFLVTGVLLLALGVSGWVRRAMEAIPMPIVMAMVAGVFLRFGLDLVRAFWVRSGPRPAIFSPSLRPTSTSRCSRCPRSSSWSFRSPSRYWRRRTRRA